MAHGQYEPSALATADEALRFADVEKDLFPSGDVDEHDAANEELEPWIWSAADRTPVERQHAHPA